MGGPADGTTQVAPTCSMYDLALSIPRWRFWAAKLALERFGMSYTIGYQIAPEY